MHCLTARETYFSNFGIVTYQLTFEKMTLMLSKLSFTSKSTLLYFQFILQLVNHKIQKNLQKLEKNSKHFLMIEELNYQKQMNFQRFMHCLMLLTQKNILHSNECFHMIGFKAFSNQQKNFLKNVHRREIIQL